MAPQVDRAAYVHAVVAKEVARVKRALAWEVRFDVRARVARARGPSCRLLAGGSACELVANPWAVRLTHDAPRPHRRYRRKLGAVMAHHLCGPDALHRVVHLRTASDGQRAANRHAVCPITRTSPQTGWPASQHKLAELGTKRVLQKTGAESGQQPKGVHTLPTSHDGGPTSQSVPPSARRWAACAHDKTSSAAKIARMGSRCVSRRRRAPISHYVTKYISHFGARTTRIQLCIDQPARTTLRMCAGVRTIYHRVPVPRPGPPRPRHCWPAASRCRPGSGTGRRAGSKQRDHMETRVSTRE